MALILNIDTALETAVISICENDKVLSFTTNSNQKDHASFLHVAIKDLLQKAGLPINKLNAITVTSGPGSYTGIRVGMASAKGLCYALHIPLITINTLEVIALSAINQIQDNSALYCPMIDARRMEVFTAVYDADLKEIIQPASIILNESYLKELLKSNKIYFSGNGALKLKDIVINENAFYTDKGTGPGSMAKLAHEKFITSDFADVSYASPMYLKEFYTVQKAGT